MKVNSRKKKQRVRRCRVEPVAVISLTLGHRSGWYVHPDIAGQQQRMMS